MKELTEWPLGKPGQSEGRHTKESKKRVVTCLQWTVMRGQRKM